MSICQRAHLVVETEASGDILIVALSLERQRDVHTLEVGTSEGFI